MPRGDQVEFRLVAESDDWLVVDKPPGVLVHPTKPGGPWTLWDGLRELLAYEVVNGVTLSIITRLDRETSGLVLVAKGGAAARRLAGAIAEGQIGKCYRAVVFGWPDWQERTIAAPILRQGTVRPSPVWLKRCVDPRGAGAVTHFRVLERLRHRGRPLALLEATPRTGRTHQIRVHAAEAGFPLVGDKLYGTDERWYLRFIDQGWTAAMARALWLPRHALHACELAFEGHVIRSPLPGDLERMLRVARKATDSGFSVPR